MNSDVKKIFCVVLIIFSFGVAQPLPYKNPSIPIEQRVNDLLSRMTLDEMVSQMRGYVSPDTLAFDVDGNFIGVQDTAILKNGLGSFGTWALRGVRSPRYRAQCINGIQRYMIEKSRLGIPLFVHMPMLHGMRHIRCLDTATKSR